MSAHLPPDRHKVKGSAELTEGDCCGIAAELGAQVVQIERVDLRGYSLVEVVAGWETESGMRSQSASARLVVGDRERAAMRAAADELSLWAKRVGLTVA